MAMRSVCLPPRRNHLRSALVGDVGAHVVAQAKGVDDRAWCVVGADRVVVRGRDGSATDVEGRIGEGVPTDLGCGDGLPCLSHADAVGWGVG